ncbi:MAG: hypothetical protein IRZ06_08060 [Nevskia sp.]|nr:hypothetical protein [Nevskia sp.]
MCLIIYKPAGLSIPTELIEAAAHFNRDGWGLMGHIQTQGCLCERHERVDPQAILRRLHVLEQAELCLHLRLRTRGSRGLDEAQPFKITDRYWLMHNGTLRLPPQPGHSDSRLLAERILRPLFAAWPELPIQAAFVALVEAGLGPENKVVLFDAEWRRFHFFNYRYGAEFEGLWLSSTRWIDRRRLALAHAPQPQAQSYPIAELEFV